MSRSTLTEGVASTHESHVVKMTCVGPNAELAGSVDLITAVCGTNSVGARHDSKSFDDWGGISGDEGSGKVASRAGNSHLRLEPRRPSSVGSLERTGVRREGLFQVILFRFIFPQVIFVYAPVASFFFK